MDRVAEGDAAAFGALYDALEPELRALLQETERDPAVVEALLEETFLHLYQAREHYVRGSDVTAWARAVATRLRGDPHPTRIRASGLL